jgi:Protein of unknown function (DUF763)
MCGEPTLAPVRTGHADLRLHGRRAPRWLFERMTGLARETSLAVVAEEGAGWLLRRLSDPVWFQAFGCVLGFDWHSSGVTTTVCGERRRRCADRPDRNRGARSAGLWLTVDDQPADVRRLRLAHPHPAGRGQARGRLIGGRPLEHFAALHPDYPFLECAALHARAVLDSDPDTALRAVALSSGDPARWFRRPYSRMPADCSRMRERQRRYRSSRPRSRPTRRLVPSGTPPACAACCAPAGCARRRADPAPLPTGQNSQNRSSPWSASWRRAPPTARSPSASTCPRTRSTRTCGTCSPSSTSGSGSSWPAWRLHAGCRPNVVMVSSPRCSSGARVRFAPRGELGPYGFLQRLRRVPPLVRCHVWPVRGSGWRDGAVG